MVNDADSFQIVLTLFSELISNAVFTFRDSYHPFALAYVNKHVCMLLCNNQLGNRLKDLVTLLINSIDHFNIPLHLRWLIKMKKSDSITFNFSLSY